MRRPIEKFENRYRNVNYNLRFGNNVDSAKWRGQRLRWTLIVRGSRCQPIRHFSRFFLFFPAVQSLDDRFQCMAGPFAGQCQNAAETNYIFLYTTVILVYIYFIKKLSSNESWVIDIKIQRSLLLKSLR